MNIPIAQPLFRSVQAMTWPGKVVSCLLTQVRVVEEESGILGN